jgi:WD40 repeat protein
MKKVIFLFAFLYSFQFVFSDNIIWRNPGYFQEIKNVAISNDYNYMAICKDNWHINTIHFWDLANKKKIYSDTHSLVLISCINDYHNLCYWILDKRTLVIKDKDNNIITNDTLPFTINLIKSIPFDTSKILMRSELIDSNKILFLIYNFKTHEIEEKIFIDKSLKYLNSTYNFYISPNGKYLVFYCFYGGNTSDPIPQNIVYIYNFQTKELKSKAAQNYQINSLTISDDSKFMVTAGGSDNYSIAYWDIEKGDTIRTFSGSNMNPISTKMIGSDTLILYDVNNYNIHYFDLINGSERAFAEIKEKFNYCYFIKDSFFVSVDENSIKYFSYNYKDNPHIHLDTVLFDVNTNNFSSNVWGVDISPDNSLIISGGNNKELKLWNSLTGDFLYNLTSTNTVDVRNVKFSHKGNRVAWIALPPKKLLVISTIQQNNNFTEISDSNLIIYNLAWSPDDKSIAVCGKNDSVYILDSESGQIQYVLGGSTQEILSIAYSPDGKLLSIGNFDCNLIVWNLFNKQIIIQKKVPPKYGIWDLDFSKDGNLLALACGDGYTRVLKTTDWSVQKELDSKTVGYIQTSAVYQSKFLANSKKIIGGLAYLFKIWDYNTGNDYKVYDDLRIIDSYRSIMNLAVSHDGSFIVTVSNYGDVIKWVGLDQTNIEDPKKSVSDKIFPNPTSDYIYLKNSDIFNSNIQIFNSLGIKMLESNYQDRIDVRDFAPGLYFIRVGKEFKKFVKE